MNFIIFIQTSFCKFSFLSCKPSFVGYRDQNQIYINTDLVAVIDTSTGNKATKLRLPGNYKLVFGEVIVNTDLDFMFSDIRLELDVPGFGKLNAIPTCDNQSHTVTVEGAANSYWFTTPAGILSKFIYLFIF